MSLLWATSEDEKPFVFIFDLPDGAGGSMIVSLEMEPPQAQAVYNALPRRVPKHEMPPECLLEAAPPPKPRKKKKAPQLPSEAPQEGSG
jgi:hypothetical protein